MAMGNRFRLNSGISASDGSTQTQQNLNVVLGRPGLPATFLLDDTAVPSIPCGINQSLTGSTSKLTAIGAKTDDANVVRLCVDNGSIISVPRGDIVRQQNIGAPGDLYTNTTSRILYISYCFCYNAVGDAIAYTRSGGTTKSYLAANSAADLSDFQNYSNPIPLFPGEIISCIGTANVSIIFMGWFK